MAQPEKEYCGGPGGKLIFATKALANDELRRYRAGRKCKPGTGMTYRCQWGEHYHMTSHKRPGGGR